jgi:endonuclease YncB( thermonuclease family)
MTSDMVLASALAVDIKLQMGQIVSQMISRFALLLIAAAPALSVEAATFADCPKLSVSSARSLIAVRVVKIIDGDTIDVSFSDEPATAPPYQVRLAGIDAPEKDQPYGKASAAMLRACRRAI